MENLNRIVLSLTIANCILDVYILDINRNFVGIYFFIFHFVNSWLNVSVITPLILFIFLLIFHFSQDFKFINGGDNFGNLWAGVFVVTSTTFLKKNQDYWIQSLKQLTINQHTREEIVFILNLYFYFSLMLTLVTNYIFYNNIIILTIYFTAFATNMNPFDSILCYIGFFNAPITIYKFYIAYGINISFVLPAIFGLIYWFSNLFICKLSSNTKPFKLLISCVICHILFVTYWDCLKKNILN